MCSTASTCLLNVFYAHGIRKIGRIKNLFKVTISKLLQLTLHRFNITSASSQLCPVSVTD